MRPLLPLLVLLTTSTPAADPNHGTLLFEDSFDRDEPTANQEAIGNGWTSNSAWRAQGKKQVDLKDDALFVTRVPEADHGVAIFHDVAFQDGAVQLRFQLGEGDDLGIDFVDREDKTIHAGHLCLARVTLKNLTLTDSKTGGMNLALREARQNNTLTAAQKNLLKTKSKTFPHSLAAKTWHTLLITVEGDQMRATLNGQIIGTFQSEGIAHPTKRMITLAVNQSAAVDDVKVWKLK
jgi:hypothetical protein